MRALVVGMPWSRGVLAAARSLARAGWQVGVASSDTGLASSSRFATRRHEVPPVERDAALFVEAVRRCVRDASYDVIFGGNEAEVLALSAARDELGARFPYAPHSSLVSALDKHLLSRAAVAAGLEVPRCLDPATARAAKRPVIVKARVHAKPHEAGRPARIDTNLVLPHELTTRIEDIERQGGEVLIQEFLHGPLMAYCVLLDHDGRAVVEVQQEASRIWPPGAGASARACTVPIDEGLARACRQMLQQLGWVGLAEIQFVRGEDRIPRLIDLNARFYGSQALATAAGADIPAAWAALAIGKPVAATRARPGVRYQWLMGDLKRARAERRGGVLADVATSIGYALTAHHSVWDPRDPRPALREVRRQARARQKAGLSG